MEVLGASQNIPLESSSQRGPSKQRGCCVPLPQHSGKDGRTCKAVSAQLLMKKNPHSEHGSAGNCEGKGGEGGEWDGE